MKPYAESSDQNKDVILVQLRHLLKSNKSVLEIGSGTGQHAVHFAKHLPHLHWHPSDLVENLSGIQAWLNEQPFENLHTPIELDVKSANWPQLDIDAIYTANTLHIMSINEVELFFQKSAALLQIGQQICIYGPFSYHGKHISESNVHFDQWLKQRQATQGVRDIDELTVFAESNGLKLINDISMPANNQILVWSKS